MRPRGANHSQHPTPTPGRELHPEGAIEPQGEEWSETMHWKLSTGFVTWEGSSVTGNGGGHSVQYCSAFSPEPLKSSEENLKSISNLHFLEKTAAITVPCGSKGCGSKGCEWSQRWGVAWAGNGDLIDGGVSEHPAHIIPVWFNVWYGSELSRHGYCSNRKSVTSQSVLSFGI